MNDENVHGKPLPPASAAIEEIKAIEPGVFQQAVEQADIAISITDANANILYVNPAFSRVTGFPLEEAVGANQSLLSNRSTPDSIYTAMWEQITTGAPWSGHLVNRRKDGSKYLADLLITPVTDRAGGITHFLGIQRDITTLHQLECEVADQKALIESVVDSAPVVLALLDSRDKVVLDNHEYKKLMADLHVAEPATQFLEAVRAELGAGLGTPQEGRHAFNDREIRIETPGAARWFTCSGIWVQRKDGAADSFFDRQNELYLLLVAKETTRQRAEQEKTRMALLQAMMAEENRIDGLREILTAAVFKIEGPINIMASVLATMERRGSGANSPASGVLAEAMRAGREAIDSLRSVIPEHKKELRTSVNINEVIRDVLDLTTVRMLSAGVSVQWKPQTVLPTINAYSNRMRTLFKALVDNAIDAMNTKGWRERELVITTHGDMGSGNNDSNVEIVIEDSGPGIPPELRLKVFEPFFSTRKASGHHLGTGLSSAQQVVADHNGVIDLEETARGGCRVRVTLPAQYR